MAKKLYYYCIECQQFVAKGKSIFNTLTCNCKHDHRNWRRVYLEEDLQVEEKSVDMESFEIAARYVKHYGFLGIVKVNDKEVCRTGSFKSTISEAIESAEKIFSDNYLEFLLKNIIISSKNLEERLEK